MEKRIVECVPNFSEGRDKAVIDAITAAIVQSGGVKLLDVDPGEAEKLLKVIELLFKNWYIAEHENQQLYAEIAQIAEDKENERKSGAVDSNGQ